MSEITGESVKKMSEAARVVAVPVQPKGWVGRYRNPYFQVILLGFTPGLYLALTGLGGAGQVDETAAANSNDALYACFAAMAFVSGTIHNKIGSKATLFLGTLGYPLYIASFLASNLQPFTAGMNDFNIIAGAVLGVTAGLLWTAQGSLMLAYPTEAEKGRFIGIFWVILSLGAMIGSTIAFAQNYKSDTNSVGNTTYEALIALTCFGTVLSLLLANPNEMYRTDGTKVAPPRHPTWKAEIIGLAVTIRRDPLILLLFPLFLASNWFYTWQFNDYNGALFTIRTRGLNGMVYWASQMMGSMAIGSVLDYPRISRRVRALIGWSILLVVVMVTHGWAYHYQQEYTRESIANPAFQRIDFSTPGYAAYVWLYIFLGALDRRHATGTWELCPMIPTNSPTSPVFTRAFSQRGRPQYGESMPNRPVT